MGYAELLASTNFSFLEGVAHPEELSARAARVGVSHLGIADRDGVYGLVRAHQAAKESGVHLLCGATITVQGCPSVALLAKDSLGWSNLCRLITESQAETAKGRAHCRVEQLVEWSEGLVAVLRYGWTQTHVKLLKSHFRDQLCLAWTRDLTRVDGARWRWATELSSSVGVPIVATNDPLMLTPDQRPLADVLTAIRRRQRLDQLGRASLVNAERYLLDEPTFRRRYAASPEAIENAMTVAESCSFTLDSLRYRYPKSVVPPEHTAIGWLRHLVYQGLRERYDDTPSSVVALVEHELAVIDELDFASYFLTVNDIVVFARSCHILCQGRGSAANSAVCYALGITAVDPARSTLLFERFISKERGEPPDIDVDFEHERREEVIQYIYEKYGRDRAAILSEVVTYRRRSAVRDVGKVLGLTQSTVDLLSKATNRWAAGPDVTWQALVKEAGLDSNDARIRMTMRLADQMAGIPRHSSIHVGGFTITETPLIEMVPVEPASMPNRTIIQWDKYDIEHLGFVKVDILALGILTCIRKGFELIKQGWGGAYSLASVPAEEAQVYEMFCQADTVGVFQIESRAQMSMLPRLQPRCFYDLVIEVALVRPGPIQGGMVHPYLRRRRGDEPVEYAHQALVPILERTLGVPLFQEQVMQMAVTVGGFSAGKADALRRAMGAWRRKGHLRGIGSEFVAGMRSRGISPEYANAIYKQIQGFAEYGFPESHAASFALLVYVSGWLKCFYPAAFAAALLNSQPLGFYSPRAIVADAERHGVKVLPVCVVESRWDCSIEWVDVEGQRVPGLRLGMRLIRGLKREAADRVLTARNQHPFASLMDLSRRTTLARDDLRRLTDANALKRLEPVRRRAAWALQGFVPTPLFGGIEVEGDDPGLPEESVHESLSVDFGALGLSVGRHPVPLIRAAGLANGSLSGTCLVSEVIKHENGTVIRVVGLVVNRQRPKTASGVLFMTLEDETGMLNMVVWPKIWQRWRCIAQRNSYLGVEGRVQREGLAVNLVVRRFWDLPDSPIPQVPSRDFR